MFLSELTEHIPELNIIPRKAWEFVGQGLRIGRPKHGKWESSKGQAHYLAAARRHLEKLEAGETWDKDDGHHHAAAMVIRCLQVLDGCGGNGG